MHTRAMRGLVVMVWTAALGVPPALAAPVVIQFGGELTFVGGSDELDPSIVVGAAFFGSVVYDPATAEDEDSNEHRGRYLVGTPMTGQIGDVSFESDDSTEVYVADDTGFPPPLRDTLRLSGFREFEGDRGEAALAFTRMVVELKGDVDVFDSDALPLELDLADFTELQRFTVRREEPPERRGEDPFMELEGTITSLTVVPEPSTALLLAVGGLGLLVARIVPTAARSSRSSGTVS